MRRRDALRTLAALGLVACDTSKPNQGILGAMARVNRRFETLLYSPELEATAQTDLTPEDAFPAYHIAPDIPIAPPGWRLSVGGRVARPRTFSLDDLMRLPRTDVRLEHHCVEGWSATANWHGVRLSELAELVGAEGVDYVEFRSFDAGYFSSWDRDSALHPQTLLAYGMNGRPLAPAHGAPLRLYAAVKLGYKQVKYLTEIIFVDRETGGTWEDRGYEWYAGV